MKHRFSSMLAVVAALLGSLVMIGATSSSAGAVTTPVATRFAYGASGFGTLLKGGQIPAGSSMTAFRPLGCTNLAGLSRENHEAASPLGGLGSASVIATRVWTTKVGSVFSSYAKNTIANVALGDPSLGTLAVKGVTSQSRAFHNSTGFHAATVTTVASISFAPAGLPAQTIPVPTPGQSIDLPGLGTLYAGTSSKYLRSTGATAKANALKVVLTATGTTVTIGHSEASIGGGTTVGLFHGSSFATKATALANNLTSGPTPLTVMPCQGTAGVVRTKKLASVNLGGQAVVGAVTSSEQGLQKAGIATGWERASVAKVTLGGGQLVISGIVGKANVTRSGSRVKSSATGTTVGTILINGQTAAFPETGILAIPGVATLERSIVVRTRTGISVVGLRITLLDGTGAVIDLGTAKLSIDLAQRPLSH